MAAGKPLKDKLESKVQNLNSDNAIQSKASDQENNIVLFAKPDNALQHSFVPDFAISLQEAKARVEMLQSFVKEMMIPHIDYGVVPGSKKPTLYKSGAEKLCDIFGLSKHVEVINRLEDWEKRLFHYEIKVILINKRTGHIEAEGLGSCNNKEKKYATQDAYSVINTIIKMAKKRAIIDAVLSATRASGIFTQDIEDISINQDSPVTANTDSETSKSTASKNQLLEIVNIICQLKIPIDKARAMIIERYNANESKQLTYAQAEDFIKYLKKYKAV